MTGSGSVLISGSLAYDRIFFYPRKFKDAIIPDKVHMLNVVFTTSTVHESFGGTAGNISYTLRLLGIPADIISSAGNDFQPYRAWLLRHRIGVQGVTMMRNSKTASFHVITDRDDNQIGAFNPGSIALETAPGASLVRKLTQRSDYAIIAPGSISAMNALAVRYRACGMPFLFDPGQNVTNIPKSTLRKIMSSASGFISNDYEYALVQRRLSLSTHYLIQMVPYTIITLGSKGSKVYVDARWHNIKPAKPQRIVDPTGAGDAYRSGLLAGLACGLPVPVACTLGSVASVYTVEKHGTQTHRFTHEQFSRRYYSTYKRRIPLKGKGYGA